MTQPLVWMRAVRDNKMFTSARMTVLMMLALRMKPDGEGFASTRQLADDAQVSEPTVKRATGQARTTGYLLVTRRGHRIDADRVMASEWRLCVPPQQIRAEPLDATQGVTSEPLDATQGVTSEPLDATQGIRDANPRDQKRHPKGSPVTPPEVFNQRSLNQRSSSSARATNLNGSAAANAGQNDDDDEDLTLQDHNTDAALIQYMLEVLLETAPLDEVGNPDTPFNDIVGPSEFDVETAEAVLHRIRRDHQPHTSLRGYLGSMARSGDLLRVWTEIEERRVDQRRQQRKAARAVAGSTVEVRPEPNPPLEPRPDYCEHGERVDLTREGRPRCPLCRRDEEAAPAMESAAQAEARLGYRSVP